MGCKLRETVNSGIPFIQGRNGVKGPFNSYGPTWFLQQQRPSLYPAPFSPSSEHRLSLSLANLKKYTKYSVVVQAYNRLGAGPRSEEINVMTGEDGVYRLNELICRVEKVGSNFLPSLPQCRAPNPATCSARP